MTREGEQHGGYGGAFFDPVTGKPVDTSQWDPGSGSVTPQSQPYTSGPGTQQGLPSNQPQFQQDQFPQDQFPQDQYPQYQQQAYPQPQFQQDQYQQGPYQQGPYQQTPYSAAGFPLPPHQSGTGPPTPQPNTRSMTIVSVSVGVVVLLVVGFVLLGKSQDEDGGKAEPKAAPPPSSTSSTSSTSSAPTTTAAAVSGWQGVLDDEGKLAYDVPPKWNIAEQGTITGFEKPDKDAPFGAKPYVTGHASAEFKGDCAEKGGQRALTAVTKAADLDPKRAVPGAAMRWLQGANMDKKGKTPNPKVPKTGAIELESGKRAPITSISGKRLDQSGKCHAPSTRVTAVGIKSGKKTSVLVIVVDEHVPKEVADKTVRKIAGSLRPTG